MGGEGRTVKYISKVCTKKRKTSIQVKTVGVTEGGKKASLAALEGLRVGFSNSFSC